MLNWTLKSLLRQRSMLAGSAAAVACAFLLVIFFDAVFTGESRRIVAYVSNTDADVWVMQRGVSNMHMASSFVWDWKAERVAAVEGVAGVTPVLYLNTVLRAGNRDWFSYVVGLQNAAARGGPWAMEAGSSNPRAGQAVIPAVMARTAGIDIGDRIRITDRDFTVTGLSEGTFSMANSVTFVAFADLQDILSTTGTVSYLLVKAQPGVDPDRLATRIEQEVEKVSAMSRAAFIDSDYEMAMQMGVEIIALMSLIGLLLAAMIVAFTAYSSVAGKRREIAIVKALGVSNLAIHGSVVFQNMLITAAGFFVAALVAFGVLPRLPELVPQLTLVVTAAPMLRLALTAILVTVLASLLPAWLITRVDPATAFAG